MKAVCHITTTPQGSIPRLLRESSTALKAGLKPYIIAPGISFIEDGISYVGVKAEKSRIRRMVFTSRELIKQSIKIDADIYQIHDPELLPYALTLKKRGKIVIFDSHEFYGIQIKVKHYIPKNLRKLVSYLYMRFEEFVCTRIDAVIAVCTINGTNYFDKRSKQTVLIENIPDKDVFQNTKELSSIRKLRTLVYIGSISSSRGITNLIKAVGKVEGTLILCGPFISQAYHDEIMRMPEYANVDYRGVVTKAEIIEILSNSNIGISTLLHVGQYSEVDTLPTKVYEYMAMGLPVIISDFKYAKEIINEYKFGICVDPNDVNAIVNAINYILDNPDIAKNMSNEGRRAVLEKYNWEIEEKKLLSLYSSFDMAN